MYSAKDEIIRVAWAAQHRSITWMVFALLLSVQIFPSCGSDNTKVHRELVQAQQASTPIVSDLDAQVSALCERIPEIKVLPFHDERGEDATYDAFMDAGEKVVPCLIEKLTDVGLTPDPRITLKFPETTIGDIAYFLLIDITKLEFAEMLPPKVQKDYKANGVWAYHAYVSKVKHRKELQRRFDEWYRKKSGRHP